MPLLQAVHVKFETIVMVSSFPTTIELNTYLYLYKFIVYLHL